jgi:hypothetical protein
MIKESCKHPIIELDETGRHVCIDCEEQFGLDPEGVDFAAPEPEIILEPLIEDEGDVIRDGPESDIPWWMVGLCVSFLVGTGVWAAYKYRSSVEVEAPPVVCEEQIVEKRVYVDKPVYKEVEKPVYVKAKCPKCVPTDKQCDDIFDKQFDAKRWEYDN